VATSIESVAPKELGGDDLVILLAATVPKPVGDGVQRC
jgi:hypothetical protein